MPKNRQITRENRKREEAIDRQNKYGINDPTPYKAVQRIVQGERGMGGAKSPCMTPYPATRP